MAGKIEPDMILEYYKDWDSDNAPLMMMLDISDSYPGVIESEDQIRMANLRKKYQNLSK